MAASKLALIEKTHGVECAGVEVVVLYGGGGRVHPVEAGVRRVQRQACAHAHTSAQLPRLHYVYRLQLRCLLL